MEENLQNQGISPIQAQPVNNQIENKKKPWVKISLFVLLGLVLFAGVFYAGIKFSNIKEQNNKLQPTIPQTQTGITTPSQTDMNIKRVLYFKEDKLFSITPDGIKTHDLSTNGIQASKNSEIIISKNGEKFCFVKDYNIFCANTDGTQTKQITDNISVEPSFDVVFVGINDNGTKLLFSYELPKGMGDFEENLNIKYGIYCYDSSAGIIKFVMKSFNIQQGETYDFIEFIGDEPIFTQIFNGYLYKLNLDNNQFVQFSQIQLPAISYKAFINSEEKIVIYSAAYSSGGWQVWKDNTIPDSYSQIVLLNYINGTKVGISPVGSFAEYQELSVSPKFKNVFYGHQIRQGIDPNPIKTNFYFYNSKNKHTQALSTIDVPYLTPLWLDEDTFLYTGKEKPVATVYKINLISGKTSTFLENVDRLIFP